MVFANPSPDLFDLSSSRANGLMEETGLHGGGGKGQIGGRVPPILGNPEYPGLDQNIYTRTETNETSYFVGANAFS